MRRREGGVVNPFRDFGYTRISSPESPRRIYINDGYPHAVSLEWKSRPTEFYAVELLEPFLGGVAAGLRWTLAEGEYGPTVVVFSRLGDDQALTETESYVAVEPRETGNLD